MCGIFGAISWGAPLNPTDFVAMGDAIRHRGPDDAGLFVAGARNVVLGHRRLSIIDLSENGRQPLWNEDRTVGLVFNGEIYNFQDLRHQLERAGHVFRSDTDSEVIVHGYEQYGEEVLDKLDGMFAFGLWDANCGHMLLVRDRMGKKPLYVWRNAACLLFASELKSLLSHRAVSRDVDFTAVSEYLSLGYVPAPRTMLKDIQKLQAAQRLRIAKDGRIDARKFWQLPRLGANTTGGMDAVSHVRRLTTAAVEKRLIADVPVGALLSGGIDSAVVVGLMSRASAKPLQTFTVGFEAGPRSAKLNEDLRRARITAAHFGTEHRELVLDSRADLDGLLRRAVWHLDEPNANATVLSTLAVSEFARRGGVKVVLTGDGGDELFAGYPRYLYDHYVQRAQVVPRVVRRAGAQLLRHIPSWWANKGARFLDKTLALDDATPAERYLAWRRQFQPAEQRRVLATELARAVDGGVPAGVVQYLDEFADAPVRDRLSYADLCLWVADESNVRVDRMTMASSLEARCPLLDRALVEYVMNLSVGRKIAGRETKIVLKRAFADLLPPEIVHGSKKGFTSPVRWWLETVLPAQVDSLLAPERIRRVGLLDPDGIAELRRGDGWKRPPLKLWSVLILQLWAEQYLLPTNGGT